MNTADVNNVYSSYFTLILRRCMNLSVLWIIMSVVTSCSDTPATGDSQFAAPDSQAAGTAAVPLASSNAISPFEITTTVLPVSELSAALSIDREPGLSSQFVPSEQESLSNLSGPISQTVELSNENTYSVITAESDKHDSEVGVNGALGAVDPVKAENAAATTQTEATESNKPEPEDSQNKSGGSTKYNGNLLMGGLFYGNYQSGAHTANAQIAIETSRRFRASKTGNVATILYHNRILEDSEISSRYSRCAESDLDSYTCGYTYGNMYQVGNGGSIVVELREDNNGLPGSRTLGKTSPVFVPKDNPNGPAKLNFSSSVPLQAGKIYHLVYTNLNPPTGVCARWPVSETQAASCPRDQGASGLNGIFLGTTGGEGPLLGPFRGSADANLFRRYGDSEEFIEDPGKLSWYGLIYTDGIETGDTVLTHRSYESPQLQVIEGSKVARQVMTVEDVDRTVNGLWLAYGHLAGSNPNGAPLTVHLKSAGGAIMAKGSLPKVSGCDLPSNSSALYQVCHDWLYTKFDTPTTLEAGTKYSVEFSAPAGARYALMVSFPGIYSPLSSNSQNFWNNAHAEISSDRGSSWGSWSSGYNGEHDLGIVFTLVDGAEQLP